MPPQCFALIQVLRRYNTLEEATLDESLRPDSHIVSLVALQQMQALATSIADGPTASQTTLELGTTAGLELINAPTTPRKSVRMQPYPTPVSGRSRRHAPASEPAIQRTLGLHEEPEIMIEIVQLDNWRGNDGKARVGLNFLNDDTRNVCLELSAVGPKGQVLAVLYAALLVPAKRKVGVVTYGLQYAQNLFTMNYNFKAFPEIRRVLRTVVEKKPIQMTVQNKTIQEPSVEGRALAMASDSVVKINGLPDIVSKFKLHPSYLKD